MCTKRLSVGKFTKAYVWTPHTPMELSGRIRKGTGACGEMGHARSYIHHAPFVEFEGVLGEACITVLRHREALWMGR